VARELASHLRLKRRIPYRGAINKDRGEGTGFSSEIETSTCHPLRVQPGRGEGTGFSSEIET